MGGMDALAPRRTLTSDEAGALCTECGLCCDGVLFAAAPLRNDEVDRLEPLGFPITGDTGEPCFAQPCVKLVGRSCTVYADRPSVCRSYRCRLLAALVSGEVGLDQARRTVATAHQLLSDAAALDPRASAAAGRAAQRAEYLEQPLSSDPATRGQQGRAQLALVVCTRFLDQNFYDEASTGPAPVPSRPCPVASTDDPVDL